MHSENNARERCARLMWERAEGVIEYAPMSSNQKLHTAQGVQWDKNFNKAAEWEIPGCTQQSRGAATLLTLSAGNYLNKSRKLQNFITRCVICKNFFQKYIFLTLIGEKQFIFLYSVGYLNQSQCGLSDVHLRSPYAERQETKRQ